MTQNNTDFFFSVCSVMKVFHVFQPVVSAGEPINKEVMKDESRRD